MKRVIRYILTLIYGVILRKKDIIVSPSCIITRETFFEGRNKVSSKCNIANSNIGRGTYIGNNCDLANIIIGRYCSIARDVKVISSTHPTSKFVSTHPAFFSLLRQAGFTFVKEQKFDEFIYFDKKANVSVKIGNDVWIGQDVKIISGIEIGDGSIIASGAVVTKSVLPYSIVGGVPAKHLKFRFSESKVEFLQKLKWWEKDSEWLVLNSPEFSDIEIFYEKFKKYL